MSPLTFQCCQESPPDSPWLANAKNFRLIPSQADMNDQQIKALLPRDVVTWLRRVFRVCNFLVSSKLSRIPTMHESFLDLTIIECLTRVEAPILFPSGWRVTLETHFLGGFPMFRSWEIADIGFLLMLRRGGRLLRSKVALLQSKRLYPVELTRDDDYERRQLIGFGRLHREDASYRDLHRPRIFSFKASSQYQALTIGDQQYTSIAAYEKEHGVPVYYLLYNPLSIPWRAHFPVRAMDAQPLPRLSVGCRVITFDSLRSSAVANSAGSHPAYSDIASRLPSFRRPPHRAGWTLQHFVVDLLLGCREGYKADLRKDERLETVFFRRTAPISAAIALTVDAPEEVPLLEE